MLNKKDEKITDQFAAQYKYTVQKIICRTSSTRAFSGGHGLDYLDSSGLIRQQFNSGSLGTDFCTQL